LEKINYIDNSEFYKREILDGKIIYHMLARTEHADIVNNISDVLKEFFKNNKNYSCKVYPGTLDLIIEDKQKLIPDIMVVCDKTKFTKRGYEGAPELVVEVISRSTLEYDFNRKKEIYEELGVKEYWIVNPYSEDIQQYAIKDGKFKFISNYFIGEEEDDFSGEIYIKDIVKVNVFPELEVKVADIFYFDF